MQKLGMFIGSMEGGGAERVVLNLANEFNERKIPFILILRFKKGPYLNQINSNIQIVELNANNPLIIIYKLIKVCKINNIDTLFIVSRYNNVLGLIANIFLKKRIVIREANTFDGFYKRTNNLLEAAKSKVLLNLIRILYPKADKIIANSDDTAKDIKKHITAPEDKIVIINNPLIDNKIKAQSNKTINDKNFLNTTTPRIISIGRLVYQKNYQHLIKSFALVKETLPTASLIILGKGPQEVELKELSKKLKLQNDIHFLGFVDNPYKYLKNSDIFVLSSIFEGFGNVLVEALAVGLPIVSTACSGGPRKILDNGKYGELVPVNDEVALYEAIIKTLKKKHDKQKLIDRSNNYSIERIADKYLKNILGPNA